MENVITLDDIKPNDSVSNVSSRGSRKGFKTTVSTASSLHIKAETDMAAFVLFSKTFKGQTCIKRGIARKIKSTLIRRLK